MDFLQDLEKYVGKMVEFEISSGREVPSFSGKARIGVDMLFSSTTGDPAWLCLQAVSNSFERRTRMLFIQPYLCQRPTLGRPQGKYQFNVRVGRKMKTGATHYSIDDSVLVTLIVPVVKR